MSYDFVFSSRRLHTGCALVTGVQTCALPISMTLHTGLRLPQAIAGLIALSSYVPLHEHLEAEATPAGRQTPIFIAHGDRDPVVPFAWGDGSASGLKERGYQVEWHRYAMAHEVCEDEIAEIDRKSTRLNSSH